MEELLKKIGIEESGEYTKNGSYKIDLEDYDEYGKYYSLLDKAREKGIIDEISDISHITLQETNVSFSTKDYQLVLQGDLDNDLYSLVILKYDDIKEIED
jgi:hypothetical protein